MCGRFIGRPQLSLSTIFSTADKLGYYQSPTIVVIVVLYCCCWRHRQHVHSVQCLDFQGPNQKEAFRLAQGSIFLYTRSRITQTHLY